MFYVKGNSHILSFSNPLTNQQEEEGLILLTEQQTDTSSFIVHHLLRSIDMLPAFLVIASSLSLMAYLYTILLIPTVMTATIPMLNNQTLNTTNNAINVPIDIGCPFLLPQTVLAKDVHDLRPDDIRIVIGLGDSVMAGFAAKGIQDDSFFRLSNLYENRGISFAMGGVKYIYTLFILFAINM